MRVYCWNSFPDCTRVDDGYDVGAGERAAENGVGGVGRDGDGALGVERLDALGQAKETNQRTRRGDVERPVETNERTSVDGVVSSGEVCGETKADAVGASGGQVEGDAGELDVVGVEGGDAGDEDEETGRDSELLDLEGETVFASVERGDGGELEGTPGTTTGQG